METERCDNCKWYVEVIGIQKPHPERCRYDHFINDARELRGLPVTRWCMYYRSEDGKARMRPLEGVE